VLDQHETKTRQASGGPGGGAASSAGASRPISILIRTLNEADRIEAAIRSALPIGGEIIVIDAGSSDDTAAIAELLGAKVIVNPWPGFGPQRYFGEEKCAHDLIFALDADEIVTPEFVRELHQVLDQADPPRLMQVRKAMIFPHHKKPPPLGFCTTQIYIYDRRIARTNSNPNWDKLDIASKEPVHLIKAPIWHFSYRDWNHVVQKANYVAQLAADTSPVRSRLGLLFRLVFEFPATFFKFYFLRRYFLAGADGFTMAMLSAFGRYLRIAKMLERADFNYTRNKTNSR